MSFHKAAHKDVEHPAGQVAAEPQHDVERPFDVTAFIMDYECGEADEDRIVEGFQYMIDTGLAWRLQGSYGRMAAALIESGHCSRP